MLDFRRLCEDYGIPTAPQGDSYYRDGWVNIHCPHHGGSKFHLGWNTSFGYFNCWVEGQHNTFQTIQKLLNLSGEETKRVLQEYDIKGSYDLSKENKVKAQYCDLPFGTKDLLPQHINYLKSRNFNPDKLVEEWGIKGTIALGPYANRIIIPINFHNTLCSYQGRDITGQSNLRYKACKSSDEVIDHQSIVYGLDKAVPHGQCVIVEGVFDAWRLGSGAVCCFGIEFTNKQVYLLAKHFKKVYILFDNEYNAQRQADYLRGELSFRGVDCEIVEWDEEKHNAKDPAEMSDIDAEKLMKQLGFRKNYYE